MKLICRLLGHDYEMLFHEELNWYFACTRCGERVEGDLPAVTAYHARRLAVLAVIVNGLAVSLSLTSMVIGSSTFVALNVCTVILNGTCIVANVLAYRLWEDP